MNKKHYFFGGRYIPLTELKDMITGKIPCVRGYLPSETRKEFYHYTDIESLLIILSTAMFKFSRIDRVNDPLEKDPLVQYDLYRRIFIACFCKESIESIPLWKIYTQRGKGVRIGFFYKEGKINDHFVDPNRSIQDDDKDKIEWICCDKGQVKSGMYLAINDVSYVENPLIHNFHATEREDELEVMPDLFAMYKSTMWSYEKETRLVAYLFGNEDNDIDTKSILVPFDTSQLDHIEVRFDPWMSEELKECLKLGVDKYASKWNIKVEYQNSDLCNKIV